MTVVAPPRLPARAGVSTTNGVGELTKKLTVRAHRFSEAAKAKVEAAGGTTEVVE